MKQLSFIQLSDTHFRSHYKDDPLENVFSGVTNPATNLVAELQKIDFTEVDFIVITGDLVHDGCAEDYKNLKSLIEGNVPVGFPVYYCLGNHDDKKCFYKGFYDIENKSAPLDYVEEMNGYRLIFLDTSVDFMHSGYLSDEQLDWLEETLKENSEAGSLLFMHHPLVWKSEKTTQASERLFDLLAKSDVISIHSGHLHFSGLNHIGKIPQFSIESLAFGLDYTKEMVHYTNRNSYNFYSIRNREIFAKTIYVNPNEKVVWALTREENEQFNLKHYGK